jgi:Phage tail lysozyme
MSNVTDTLTPSPDAASTVNLGPADVPEPAAWLDAFKANWRLGADDTLDQTTANKVDAYNQLTDSLTQMGKPASRYRDADGQISDEGMQNAWADVIAARQADPQAFSNIPAKTQAEFDQWGAGRQGGHAQDIRTASTGGFGTSFLPGLLGVLRSPEEFPLMLMGGGEGGLLSAATRQFGIGVITSAITAPETVAARAARGESTSTGDLLENAGMAGAGNVGLFGLHVVGATALDALLSRFRADVPPEVQTPVERDAAHAVQQDYETQTSSPYTDTHPGLALHADQLQAAIDAVQGQTPAGAEAPPRSQGNLFDKPPPTAPTAPAHLDPNILAGLQTRGVPEPIARGIAAGIHAESGSNPNALNTSTADGKTAFGIGQWRGARQAALIDQYGPHPTLDQQLDFLVSELHGGDPGGAKVLAQADEAAALHSYIHDFMRPKEGYQTDRDIASGMAALGRPSEAAGEIAAETSADGESAQDVADLEAVPPAVPAGESAAETGAEAAAEVAPEAQEPSYESFADFLARRGEAPIEPAAEAAAEVAPEAEAPAKGKSTSYTVDDPISGDEPETVRVIETPKGDVAIVRDDGQVIDITKMREAGFSNERAVAQSLGQDTSGENVREAPGEQVPGEQPPPQDILSPPTPEGVELDPAKQREARIDAMRRIVAGNHPLNDTETIARRAGMTEPQAVDALNALVSRGEVGWTKPKTRKVGAVGSKNRRTITTKEGRFRRLTGPVNRGPQDVLRFIARGGGIRPSGMTEKEELLNYSEAGLPGVGHDLKNTGVLDHFVPGGGWLLRANGKSLDHWGELIHEAGYLGPPEITPRPTERELIDFLDNTIRSKRKVYAGDDQPPEEKIRGTRDAPEGYQSEEHYQHDRDLWQQSAERVIGRDLTDEEFADARRIFEQGIDEPFQTDVSGEPGAHDRGEQYDEHVREMVNREMAAAVEDAFYEHEDEHYENVEHQFRDASAASEAGAAGPRGEGPDADTRDAGAREEGSGARASDDRPPALTPAQRDELDAAGLGTPPVHDPEQYAKFDDPAGEGVQAAADSAWHDIEASEPKLQEFGREGNERFLTYKGKDGRVAHIHLTIGEDGTAEISVDPFSQDPNKFGVGEVRNAANQLKELYPEIKRVVGERQSGAKPGRVQSVDLPESAPPAEAPATADPREVLRKQAHDNEEPGDVALANGKFASFEDAKEIAGPLLRDGTLRNTPYQYANVLDILPRDWDRMVEWGDSALRAPAEATPTLDLGEQADPNKAAVARQEAQLQAEQPLTGARKTGTAQADTMPEGLFGGAEEPKFDLEDGKGPRTVDEIAAELNAEQSGIDAIKGCL